MNAKIYYFSGTGNSLVIARDIAESINGNLIPIASLINKETIIPGSDVIGIIFPVYYIDHDCIPIIVQKFIKKLKNISTTYIFAVCTFGGGSFKTFSNLNKLIIAQGGKVSAGFGVQMPQNAFYKSLDNNSRKMLKKWKEKLEIIHKTIYARKSSSFLDMRDLLVKLIMTPIVPIIKPLAEKAMSKYSNSSRLPFNDLIALSDKSYKSDEKCNGCGICLKVCPVNNIKLVDNKPVWLNQCETCLACYNWCPNKAIQGGISQKGYYYCNPDVTVSDIMHQKEDIELKK